MEALDKGKKRHPISKIPLSGPSCEEFPLFSSSCALPPSLFSSSLLFFFNQAVWGCQVFWDEDSQPCEKLIPCGPSSPWRSSPWEHWWWLAGRWWWAGLVERRRWDEHRATLTISLSGANSSITDSEAHTWTIRAWYATVPCHIGPSHSHTITLHEQRFPPLFSTILPPPPPPPALSQSPNSETFWWGSLPDRHTAGTERAERICSIES